MRRSSSAFLEEEAVDCYLYAWVRTGEGLAPRRFSIQNFYVPGVKLRYTIRIIELPRRLSSVAQNIQLMQESTVITYKLKIKLTLKNTDITNIKLLQRIVKILYKIQG